MNFGRRYASTPRRNRAVLRGRAFRPPLRHTLSENVRFRTRSRARNYVILLARKAISLLVQEALYP